MKVRIPYLIEDQLTSALKGIPQTKGTDVFGDVFLDGPVGRRVAILDFDTEIGTLQPGAKFIPPAPGRVLGKYAVDSTDVTSREFNQVSVFAMVRRTMKLFEQSDVLGRPLTWAFEGSQLLVVPRAGDWANAFYERESRSLQFFYFDSLSQPGKTIYTSLSSDIVAHETGHAILDGIAPSLYDAVTPQSLALHEAVADLVAFVMSIENPVLRKAVLEQTGGDLTGSTAFSAVAQEFGQALASGRLYLRSLLNSKTLNPRDRTTDAQGEPNRVRRDEPHDLSQVVSGALYDVFVKKYLAQWDGKLSRSGRILGIACEQFKRLVLRALDYLPPGEVSFADYGRAILASDQAASPSISNERKWLIESFIKRGIVPKKKDLEVKTNWDAKQLVDLDLNALVESDWAAYEFANSNRSFLKIPKGVPFTVLPRLDVQKTSFRREQGDLTRECILKVVWEHEEENPVGRGLPTRRAINVGTTLVIDRDTRKVRALLTTDHSAKQRRARDLMLHRLSDEGILNLSSPTELPGGHQLPSVVQAVSHGGVLRVRSVARTLHIAPWPERSSS